MSSVGHCIDNGPVKGFWGIIKSEMYEITDEESLRYAINNYMHFYSKERLQDRFNCKTPLEPLGVRTEALSIKTPLEYPISTNKRIEKYKEK